MTKRNFEPIRTQNLGSLLVKLVRSYLIPTGLTHHQDLWAISAKIKRFFWTVRSSFFHKLYSKITECTSGLPWCFMDYKPGFDRRKWTITWHYINLTVVPLFGDLVFHGCLMALIIQVASKFYWQIEEFIEVKELKNKVLALNATLKVKSQIGQEEVDRMVLREIITTKLD